MAFAEPFTLLHRHISGGFNIFRPEMTPSQQDSDRDVTTTATPGERKLQIIIFLCETSANYNCENGFNAHVATLE